MKKYQITEVDSERHHAGTKAVQDVSVIAKQLGYEGLTLELPNNQTIYEKIKRQVYFYRRWGQLERTIEQDSLLVLQHPFHHKQLGRRQALKKLKDKNIKVIAVVHDVEELRQWLYNDYYKKEFQDMIEFADVLIVHNSRMKDFFLTKGIDSSKIVVLEIFDYLQDKKAKRPDFSKSLTIAGNLDVSKSYYIHQLKNLSKVDVDLYGINFDESLIAYSNLHYHGSFPADDVPEKLTRGFGLVWDGDSLDACTGNTGEYLKYNNPHKLSLYLSSGLPVVIWSQSAEAEFVTRHGLGLVVDSLYDLEDSFSQLTEKEYTFYTENVARLAKLLKDGDYMLQALTQAEKRIKIG